MSAEETVTELAEAAPLTDDQRLGLLIKALVSSTDQLRIVARMRATNLQRAYTEALAGGASPSRTRTRPLDRRR